MKLICLLFAIILLTTNFKKDYKAEKYDVKDFYKGTDADARMLVLTEDEDVVEPDMLLYLTTIKNGTYKIELTGKGDDLYQIEGTELYIQTEYCYEYAMDDEAILTVKKAGGEVVFTGQ